MAKANGKPQPPANDRVRLLQVHVENTKIIREVDIDCDGDITEIRGDSGQGKTTILQSIEGGIRGLEPSMIRNGADAATIELRLSSATIRRVMRRDGTESLMVSDSDGKPVDKAKDFLRTICSASAFRPIEWVRLGGGEAKGQTERLRLQRNQLIEALPMSLTEADIARAVIDLGDDHADALAEMNLDGVNYEQHAFVVCNAIEKACYEVRKLENARAEAAESALESTPAPDGPAPRMTMAQCEAAEEKARKAFYGAQSSANGRRELMRRRDELQARIQADEEALPNPADVEKTLGEYARRRDAAKLEIERLEALIREQKSVLTEALEKVARCEDIARKILDHEARKQDLESLQQELATGGEAVDLNALQQAMQNAEAATKARRLQDAHDKAAEAATKARNRALVYDGLVKLFRDTLPKQLIANANLPVDGLGIDEDKILIDGIPLHQLGTSQQIRVGVIIAAALNPRSAFVLVDGAESMGRNDRKALAEVAKELGLQLIMTIVDPDAVPAPGVTVMRRGEVVEAPAA